MILDRCVTRNVGETVQFFSTLCDWRVLDWKHCMQTFRDRSGLSGQKCGEMRVRRCTNINRRDHGMTVVHDKRFKQNKPEHWESKLSATNVWDHLTQPAELILRFTFGKTIANIRRPPYVSIWQNHRCDSATVPNHEEELETTGDRGASAPNINQLPEDFAWFEQNLLCFSLAQQQWGRHSDWRFDPKLAK